MLSGFFNLGIATCLRERKLDLNQTKRKKLVLKTPYMSWTATAKPSQGISLSISLLFTNIGSTGGGGMDGVIVIAGENGLSEPCSNPRRSYLRFHFVLMPLGNAGIRQFFPHLTLTKLSVNSMEIMGSLSLVGRPVLEKEKVCIQNQHLESRWQSFYYQSGNSFGNIDVNFSFKPRMLGFYYFKKSLIQPYQIVDIIHIAKKIIMPLIYIIQTNLSNIL